MPHLVIYVDQIGLNAIRAQFIDYESFCVRVERVVAAEFNTLIDEQLEAGKTVVTDHFQTSRTIPTSILVVILAWWTRAREQYAEELQHLIAAYIRDCFTGMSPAIKVTVRLEVID